MNIMYCNYHQHFFLSKWLFFLRVFRNSLGWQITHVLSWYEFIYATNRGLFLFSFTNKQNVIVFYRGIFNKYMFPPFHITQNSGNSYAFVTCGKAWFLIHIIHGLPMWSLTVPLDSSYKFQQPLTEWASQSFKNFI